MPRALLLTLVLAALSATPADASGKKADLDSTPYVDLAPTGLPIIVDGRLVNYVFVEVRLHVTPGHDSLALKAKEPWYRDAMVRAGHRRSFVKAGSRTEVDEARLKAVVLAEARRISGPKAFDGVELESQAPRKHLSRR